MPRSLSAARATVAPADEAAYLDTLAAVARHERAAGRHLWVFRSREAPDTFVEFSEGGAGHRYDDPDPSLAELEARLARVARYAPDARTRWDEVPLPPG